MNWQTLKIAELFFLKYFRFKCRNISDLTDLIVNHSRFRNGIDVFNI